MGRRQIVQRNDDKEEIVKHRLAVYYQKTAPLIKWYQSENYYGNAKYIKISGVGEVKDINEKLLKALEN